MLNNSNEYIFFTYLFILFWLHWVFIVAYRLSLVVEHGASCPTTCGILVLPARIEPVSHELEGGFLTNGPPGTSQYVFLKRGGEENIVSS